MTNHGLRAPGDRPRGGASTRRAGGRGRRRTARFRRPWSVVRGLGGALVAALLLSACDDAADGVRASVSVAEAMSGDTTGYARADRPRAFSFPRDHGPHDGFKTEWWYVTGNLESAAGERFGVQFTVFKSALRPPPGDAPADSGAAAARGSAWGADALYMAHTAVGDAARETFAHQQRFARGAAGLAGAGEERVWLGPVEMTRAAGDAVGGAVPLRLVGDAEGYVYDLTMTPEKPIVLQGDAGLSQKGEGTGNASYYYAQTRMRAAGTVTRPGGDVVEVSGLTWLDREWSTSALSAGQVGWDWFALHLDDGRDLMVYQLRRADGTADPYSKASVISADGAKRGLGVDAYSLEPLGTWASADGAAYPTAWRVRIPSEDLDLTVTAVLDASELDDATVRYWEGAVDVRGSATGRGFLEMTGYAESTGSSARPTATD